MKVSIPESLEDVTLEQSQKFKQLDSEAVDYEDNIFCLFTGIDKEQLKHIDKKDYDSVLKDIYKGLSTDGEFKQTCYINGVEFGIIPNFDKVLGTKTSKGGEYSDMIAYSKNEVDGYNPDLDRLIAVLYRPITNKDALGNYQIETYKGTSGHLKYIQKLPISIVNGCLSFFLTLFEHLEKAIQAYMVEEQLRVS